MFAFEAAHSFCQGLHNPGALLIINLAGSPDNWHLKVIILCDGNQGGGVFSKTGTTPADTRIQKVLPNARIQANAFGDSIHISANLICQVSDFIDK